jgi:hypothetical protein
VAGGCHDGCMGHWKRPYPRSPGTVAVTFSCTLFAAIAVLASVFAVRLAVEDFGHSGGPVAVTAFAASVAGVTFRAARCGLFVDARDGVMIRRFTDTTSWSWSAVSAIESRPARLLTAGISPGNETVWLGLADGEAVETPVRSIDVEDYSRYHQNDGIGWLDKSDFAMALWTMRDLHRAANARPVASREDTGDATDS